MLLFCWRVPNGGSIWLFEIAARFRPFFIRTSGPHVSTARDLTHQGARTTIRAAMHGVVAVRAAQSVADGAAQTVQRHARGHLARRLRRLLISTGGARSARDGPPFLICKPTMHASLLRALRREPSIDQQLSVHVEWGGAFSSSRERGLPDRSCCAPAVFELTLRLRGSVLCTQRAPGGRKLQASVTLTAEHPPGTVFVASLRWHGGCRTLHCLAPLWHHDQLNLTGLVSPGNAHEDGGYAFGAP